MTTTATAPVCSTFTPDLEGFKRMVAEFCKAAPTCDRDSLENGFKAVGIGYLGMQASDTSDVPLAVSYLNFATRRYWEREVELEREYLENAA